MSIIEKGGPAFPVTFQHTDNPEFMAHRQEWEGMTLRDWFAGKALGNIDHEAVAKACKNDLMEMPIFMAKVSYAIADMMLSEREK